MFRGKENQNYVHIQIEKKNHFEAFDRVSNALSGVARTFYKTRISIRATFALYYYLNEHVISVNLKLLSIHHSNCTFLCLSICCFWILSSVKIGLKRNRLIPNQKEPLAAFRAIKNDKFSMTNKPII